MNLRSLRVRLSLWYAGWLVAGFIVFAAFLHFGLKRYLERELIEVLERRGKRVAESVHRSAGDWSGTRQEIDRYFAPEANSRFVRITLSGSPTNNGSATASGDTMQVIYVSGSPADGSFDPAEMVAARPRATPAPAPYFSAVQTADGTVVFLHTITLPLPDGRSVIVEYGASREPIDETLRDWMLVLTAGVLVMLPLAVVGGFLLVSRALAPVDRIIAAAERISSRNLAERLPVPQSGDELQRVSAALNRMIERLEGSWQHTQRFQADASHELRTPLTIIQADLEAIRDKSDAQEIITLSSSALEEVERLKRIVEALFALTRLDSGEAQTESLRVDLGELVRTTVEQMSLLAQDREIRISCRLAVAAYVRGDRARLKQVVVNLLDNAIKYTPDAGEIIVEVVAEESKAVLSVSDNGIGIPADALPHIFERFYRADKARSRELGGAGLGLSIVQSICLAHGGTVQAFSRDGHGARFVVELPRDEALHPLAANPRTGIA